MSMSASHIKSMIKSKIGKNKIKLKVKYVKLIYWNKLSKYKKIDSKN